MPVIDSVVIKHEALASQSIKSQRYLGLIALKGKHGWSVERLLPRGVEAKLCSSSSAQPRKQSQPGLAGTRGEKGTINNTNNNWE